MTEDEILQIAKDCGIDPVQYMSDEELALYWMVQSYAQSVGNDQRAVSVTTPAAGASSLDGQPIAAGDPALISKLICTAILNS